MPVLLSSLINAPAGKLSGVLAADESRCWLREWLMSRIRPPSVRTFSRIFGHIDAATQNWWPSGSRMTIQGRFAVRNSCCPAKAATASPLPSGPAGRRSRRGRGVVTANLHAGNPVADWCHVPDAARLGPCHRGSDSNAAARGLHERHR